MTDTDRLMTIADLADLLGIPVTTLYGWRCRGAGPPGYRIGRYVRYRRSAVEAWLEDQTDAARASLGHGDDGAERSRLSRAVGAPSARLLRP